MTITPSHSAITATGLRKSFGDQLVLGGIDLAVPEGTVFALLGPVGAGKTTIIQILSTLIGADAGQVRVAMDMTEGIIARFRTMAIFRPSVLTGHVLGSMVRTMLSLAVVTGVALLIGFRPSATPVEWVAATGVLVMITFALTWLCVAFGLVAKTVEAASNLPQPLVFLPFLGSGFVPTESMPTGLRWFAEYQPFTPVMDTVRGLLLGTAIGDSATIAIAWCVAITLASYLWARKLYNRDPDPAR